MALSAREPSSDGIILSGPISRRGFSNIAAIAAGDQHSLALKTDGTVITWGANNSGQTNVPTELSQVMAVARSSEHSLALKSNGTVIALGNSGRPDQCSTGPEQRDRHCRGVWPSLALKQDGRVVAWGKNADSQANPPGLSNVVRMLRGRDAQPGHEKQWTRRRLGHQIVRPIQCTNRRKQRSRHRRRRAS